MGGGGGGGTEKRARSCGSVSRIREVMSGVERRAFVKIFGRGKLGGLVEVCGILGWELDVRESCYRFGRE